MAEEYRCIETGKISLLYYQGFFRKFSLKGNEFLRGLYPAVRDRDWGTVPCLHSASLISGPSSETLIRETLRFEQGPVCFHAEVRMTRLDEHEWEFLFEGNAIGDFYKNRIGWNLLLPIDSLKGRDLDFVDRENRQIHGTFPAAISPFQALKDLKALRFTDARGISVSLEFEGDLFEMEDQRNWTDASYKIYSTPLDLPFPVKVFAGETFRQRIRLGIDEPATGKISLPGFVPKRGVFPSLGLGAVSGHHSYRPGEIKALRQLDIDFLGIHLDHYSREEGKRLREHFRLCNRLGKKTVLSIALEKEETLHPRLLSLIQSNSGNVKSLELFDSRTFLCAGAHVESRLKRLKQMLPAARSGGGTFAYYAELNRAQKLCELVDYIAFSVSPQVHAFDDRSLIENLEGISYVLQDAKQKFDREIQLNALTLKQRMNFVATSKDEVDKDSEQFIDKRQGTVFAALWLLGALKRCALEVCPAVSLFETIGCKGILDSDRRFPLYYMIQEVLRHRSSVLSDLELSADLCDGLHLSGRQEDKRWIWNYGDEDICLEGLKSEQAEVFDFTSGKWVAVADRHTIASKSLYQFT